MNFDLKLGKAASVLFLALAMVGCGGGGSTAQAPMPPDPTPVDLSGVTAGYEVGPGTYDISAGESMAVGDITFSCAAGGADCTVMVAADGTAMYATEGGMVTAMNSASYQARLDQQDTLDTANKLLMLYREASGATVDATAAGKLADDALEAAEKYSGMLGVLSVEGSSVKAKNNAQMVLDARSDAIMAAKNAAAAKTRAETAKTEAGGLPEGDDKDKLIEALDAAIVVADAESKATMGIRDAKATVADSLASFVAKVEGDNEEMPDDAADIGMRVANQINTALTTAAQTPDVGTDFNAVPTAPVARTDSAAGIGEVMKGPSDAQGRTFAQIVGDMGMDMRIGSNAPTGVTTRVVTAKSVDGMTVGDVYAFDDTTTLARADFVTRNGVEYLGAANGSTYVYKGIAGVLFCAGADCKVEGSGTNLAEGDKLTGSWYFTDLDADNRYLEGTGATAGMYTLEAVTSYARYGYWLSEAAGTSPGAVTINRYAVGPAPQTAAVYGVVPANANLSGTSAMYTGKALGMSVVKMFDSKAMETGRASGGFMADARLTMKFGTAPTVGGTISNFMGDGVDPGWIVKLKDTGISTGTFTDGITNDDPDGTEMEGVWTATAWGGAVDDATTENVNEAARPTGVFGGFTAMFTNGNVAGVYATRKQ